MTVKEVQKKFGNGLKLSLQDIVLCSVLEKLTLKCTKSFFIKLSRVG